MTFAFTDGPTVTTWKCNADGEQVWRLSGDRVAEFVADRNTEVAELFKLAMQALGEPLDDEN